MKYILLILAALVLATQAHSDISFELGSIERVSNLFSYPNNCHVICFNEQTLEETVDHYLTSSIGRDGYAQSDVIVSTNNGKVAVKLTHAIPPDYQQTIENLLLAGDLALEGARKLNADKKWKPDWRFFLPLGLAMHNHKSVQLLHFPPDYVLKDAQDYLGANTTKRWASLLNINGVPINETDLYQAIIDIAPIAAPSTAGAQLNETYSYFSDFSKALIRSWTAPKQGSNTSRPLVVYGWPARQWFINEYGIYLDVLTTNVVQLSNGRTVPVLGANHPSYIWYASEAKNCREHEQQTYKCGVNVMAEDLTASCWQANMAANPNADIHDTLATCKSHWESRPKEVCMLFHMRVNNMSETNAIQVCDSIVTGMFPTSVRSISEGS